MESAPTNKKKSIIGLADGYNKSLLLKGDENENRKNVKRNRRIFYYFKRSSVTAAPPLLDLFYRLCRTESFTISLYQLVPHDHFSEKTGF
jgi:hypothetical protein